MNDKPWQCNGCEKSDICDVIVKKCLFLNHHSCFGCQYLGLCEVYEKKCIILIDRTGVVFEELGGIH